MSLLVRNVVFTIIVPGLGAVGLPWLLLGGRSTTDGPLAWTGIALIAAGVALYSACLWLFATVGRGTPGPWDAPRQLIVRGPYRWVRNPIYIGALLVVAGEAGLFTSATMVVYGLASAAFFHVFVIAYEEPTLAAAFGAGYRAYRASVWRWIPMPPAQRRG
jgi:protein-S-isoprenylcysteine O-methyltransferase Ste14